MLTASPLLTLQHFMMHVRNDGVGVFDSTVKIGDDGAGFIVMADIGGSSLRVWQWGQ